jgi:hypothetical protein
MWKASGKTTTLQLFLDRLSKKNMRDSSPGDKLKIALFGDLFGRGYGPVANQTNT